MTLNDLFQYALDNPMNVVFYFGIIPFAALLAGWMEREEGHLPPWNYLYSTLVYLVAVPAIIAVSFSVYKWMYERDSIMNANLMLQVLPIISMFLTFFIVKKQVRIESLPGLDRLGGLVMITSGVMVIMWFMDKVHIIAFTYISIQQLLLIFLVLLVVVRYGWTRIAK
ncbi:MAG: hypothetical protein ACJAZ9_002028 [Neolewinella sp.]|jgi:hypothetical protein